MDDPAAAGLGQTQAHVRGGGWFHRYGEGGVLPGGFRLGGGRLRLAGGCSRADGFRGHANRGKRLRLGRCGGGRGLLPAPLLSPELLHLLPQTQALRLLAAQPGAQLLALRVQLRQLLLHLGLHLLAALPLGAQLLLQASRGAALLVHAGLQLVEALRLLHHPRGQLLALAHQHHDDVLVLLALVLQLRRQLAVLLLQTLQLQLLHLQLKEITRLYSFI